MNTMGRVKSDLHPAALNELAALAKTLAHPARLAILQHLINRQTCVCGELVEEIGLAQATISQHLKELKSQGLLQGTVEGTSMCYCIDPKAWAALKAKVAAFLGQEVSASGRCC